MATIKVKSAIGAFCPKYRLDQLCLSKCPPHSEDRTGAEWGRMMDLSGAVIAKAEGKS